MKFLVLVMAILAGGLQLGDDEDTASHHTGPGQGCITAERIVRPIRSWQVLSTEIHYQGKTPYMEVSVHNPLNAKTPKSIDARFILSVDPGNPADPQKYNLVEAVYYNAKSRVIFKRVYEVQNVTVKKKQEKFPIQTQCFAREVIEVMDFTPDEITIPQSKSDGGVK